MTLIAVWGLSSGMWHLLCYVLWYLLILHPKGLCPHNGTRTGTQPSRAFVGNDINAVGYRSSFQVLSVIWAALEIPRMDLGGWSTVWLCGWTSFQGNWCSFAHFKFSLHSSVSLRDQKHSLFLFFFSEPFSLFCWTANSLMHLAVTYNL